MIAYQIHPTVSAFLKANEPVFRAALATIANEQMGVKIEKPEGIDKLEGGVVVNGRNIAINHQYIFDNDLPETGIPRDEETAVNMALYTISHIIITRPNPLQYLSKYGECNIGSPLNGLMDAKQMRIPVIPETSKTAPLVPTWAKVGVLCVGLAFAKQCGLFGAERFAQPQNDNHSAPQQIELTAQP